MFGCFLSNDEKSLILSAYRSFDLPGKLEGWKTSKMENSNDAELGWKFHFLGCCVPSFDKMCVFDGPVSSLSLRIFPFSFTFLSTPACSVPCYAKILYKRQKL